MQGERTSIVVVEISLNASWKIEQFQNCFKFQRYPVKWDNTTIKVLLEYKDDDEKEVFDEFAYFLRKNGDTTISGFHVEEMKKYFRKDRQLGMCDVCLLISGKLQSKEYLKYVENNEILNVFHSKITKCISDEYNNEFITQIERFSLGTIFIEIKKDEKENERYVQTGLLQIVKHKNGLCVLEILVYNCYIGGNKLLNYYRANDLNYIYRGKTYRLNGLLELFAIRRYGERRRVH